MNMMNFLKLLDVHLFEKFYDEKLSGVCLPTHVEVARALVLELVTFKVLSHIMYFFKC